MATSSYKQAHRLWSCSVLGRLGFQVFIGFLGLIRVWGLRSHNLGWGIKVYAVNPFDSSLSAGASLGFSASSDFSGPASWSVTASASNGKATWLRTLRRVGFQDLGFVEGPRFQGTEPCIRVSYYKFSRLLNLRSGLNVAGCELLGRLFQEAGQGLQAQRLRHLGPRLPLGFEGRPQSIDVLQAFCLQQALTEIWGEVLPPLQGQGNPGPFRLEVPHAVQLALDAPQVLFVHGTCLLFPVSCDEGQRASLLEEANRSCHVPLLQAQLGRDPACLILPDLRLISQHLLSIS